MSYYIPLSEDREVSIVVDRQISKGKGILDLCLTRGSNLCMKGFIDSQLEKGSAYLPVVERMVAVIDRELEHAQNGRTRELLLDLHNYAGEQLRALGAQPQGPPGEE